MSSKIETIVDHDGNVYTGKVVDVDTHAETDIAIGILTGGFSWLADSKPTVTVEVNDRRHSGEAVRRK